MTILEINNYYKLLQGYAIDDDIVDIGIFEECEGSPTFEVEYLDETLDKLTIQNRLLDYYCYRRASMNAPEMWKQMFRSIWNANIYIAMQNLINAPDFTLEEWERLKSGTADGNSTSATTGTGNNKFTNTPNEYLADGENFNGLTEMSESGSETTSAGTSGTVYEDAEAEQKNKLLKYFEIVKNNKNVLNLFFDKFEKLFSSTYVLD